MVSLGSFGAAIREFEPDGERDSFEFFGETFEVQGVVPAIVDLKISAAMAGEASQVEGDAAVFEALRHALTGPGDKPDTSQWERFYLLATSRKCHSEELMKLVFSIIGAQSGRPTERRSTSPDGSLPTSTSSNTTASASDSAPTG